MKIFNWVHWKFHHKDGFVQNVKKAAELVTNFEEESQVLPEYVTIDSILTIGSLGFGPLTQSNELNECLVLEEEETREEQEHEGVKVSEIECVEEEEADPLLNNSFRGGFDEHTVEIYEIGFESTEDLEGKKGKEKKERITLADLFVADCDDVNYLERDGGEVEKDFNYKKKCDVGAKKKGLSFAKKLIPSVGEDTRPMKKLHQMMRRMMKRKIHPDMEDILQKGDDDQLNPTIGGLIAGDYGAEGSVSLLSN